MTREIAQSEEKNGLDCSLVRREERPTGTAGMEIVNSRSTREEKLQEIGAKVVVGRAGATTGTPTGVGEVRPARKRRHRRGRTLHKHRLSKHRRDQRARSSKRVMGAPRNDNEYLMSQYDEGLLFQEAPISNHQAAPFRLNSAGFFQSCLSPIAEDDWTCAVLTPTQGSPDSCSSSPSDYSSLPSSPDAENCYHGYRELFPASRSTPERTDGFDSSSCHGVVMDGTDENFLRRNFEEEYANNITRGLEAATKEELISKCMVLMERLKELEEQKLSRVAENRFLRDDKHARVLC